MLGRGVCDCTPGYNTEGRKCTDIDECLDISEKCGNNTKCYNTEGSFYCQCDSGFRNINRAVNLTALTGQCQDVNECVDDVEICGRHASCSNLIGNYTCTCSSGYTSNQNISGDCRDIDECQEDNICGEKGKCKNEDGSFWCDCPRGYTNYGNQGMPCSELQCDFFSSESGPTQFLGGLMRNSCLALSNPNSASEEKADGDALLKKLFTATDTILSPGHLDSREDVSKLLGTVENSIMFIGPQLKNNQTKMNTSETDAVIAVRKGNSRPSGPIHLTIDNAALDTDWETATGTGTYAGFALAALLSYKNLTSAVNGSFEELKGHERDGVDPSFQIFSRVVSVVVSNPSTQHLGHSVNITLRHLEDKDVSPEVSYICAYWSVREAWSTDGCYPQHSNTSHTVCACEHLSSFAVLMALYPMEHPFGLQIVSKMGLIISIVCLILSILTFKFCRSIQGTRTTIHLHLCICLLLADIIFLAGISQTEPVGGCRFVAGMLHYFFLGVFTWMLLEGVQLYRMVVLVFNATIRPLYLFVIGYGTPLVVVMISAIIRPQRYGTNQHCWLSLKDGLIWSFYGPVCFIILVNVLFFTITVLKLAQKFTSLNPDLSKLQKMKAFTVTAIAQMCILGLMWVFGAFLFEENATAVVAAYIFTILNSLQGALIFFLHCLLSKQVREEYAYVFSCICTQQRKKLSDFSSSSNPSSSRSQGSRGGHQTGESQI
ncbi:CD97 antigen isoform X2 [Cynoglossus semilaevis]|nr:CD97 antigen isoform X2 [Cynoglossus semilaevis]XP_024914373.1 CD97 antigen isoform X2 [Cynoglossus semilaevis]